MKVSTRQVKKAVELERLFGTDMLLAASGPPVQGEAQLTIEGVREWVNECTKCRLSKSRTHIVFGEGSPKARLVFVGEGPGAEEDLQARPFVGRAGQMLNKIIENVFYLKREDVYIANIVKCRPPGNRTPLPDECGACIPYLYAQLEAIRPEIIVALGGVAAHNLLKTEAPIGHLRGRFSPYGDARLMPTYHTAYLLRNPNDKRKVYDDMVAVRKALGIEPPRK